MKNILITGGAGFIGSHLVRLMVKKYPHYSIVNVDSLTYAGNLENLNDIENYKNMYFLPDWLSEFIQVRLNICLDISVLETIREVLFVGLMIYSQMVVLRIAISWLIYINPYSFPWCC